MRIFEKFHRKVVKSSILGTVFLILIFCSGWTGKALAADETRGIIALSVLTMNNPFFKEIADNMEMEAAKHGYSLIAVSGDFDVAKQQNQVKDFIIKKVDAIVLCPCDSKAIGPAVKEAGAAGIPVFTADIACLDPSAKVISHVATDNYQGGRVAFKGMKEALNGKGKIAILDHPEVESAMLRTKGFQDALAEANSKGETAMEVVTILPGRGDRATSFKCMQDILQAHSNLDGVFCVNDPSALGAVAAMEKAGRDDQIRVIGFDGQPEAKQAIKDGKIYASAIQFPDQIGVKTVQTIMNYFNGEEVPEKMLIPTALYRKVDASKDPNLK